jgi:crotonobetainyl-CoA:carnitine CoA-transferase CaiB-like acyl-CoA transferase
VNVAQNALITGTEPQRYGNAHPNIVPYEAFDTASGQIAVAAANDGLFGKLCGALGRDDLASDDRYATNPARVENRATLIPELAAAFAERSAEHWVDTLAAAGVPVGKVRSVPGALEAAAEAGRPATMSLPHPTAGEISLVASPIWGDWEAVGPEAPPLLGQHTAEVLRELGVDEREIERQLGRGPVA